MSWKTTMPKTAPATGKQHFVFSTLEGPKGARMELAGQITKEQRDQIMAILMGRPS